MANLIIEKKLGLLSQLSTEGRVVDTIDLHWYETGKRLMHKTSTMGTAVTLKFLNEKPAFADGDVLYADSNTIITVCILPCRCIVIAPASNNELAALCYEIGNRHLPLFYNGHELLVPMDEPLYRLLQMQGYQAHATTKKLEQPLKTTVMPHLDMSNTLVTTLSNAINSTL
jgi:urease accessory protein